MDNFDDNSIRLFKCEQCANMVKMLIAKADKKRIGYMCEDCWKKYKKRLKEIYSF